jgi:hypothetical protein
MPDSVTRFLNVDLELVATFDLAPLLEYFNAETFTLRDSVAEGRRTVWMELHPDPKDTDDAILRYSMLVESLPSDFRRLWDACEDRCLNVGIQSGLAPHATAFPISNRCDREARCDSSASRDHGLQRRRRGIGAHPTEGHLTARWGNQGSLNIPKRHFCGSYIFDPAGWVFTASELR